MAALIFSVVLLLAVLELVRRRQLVEEYSLLWIALGAALIALSIRRGTWRGVAAWFGVPDVPVIGTTVAAAVICGAALWVSVIVSRQRQQIERLTEETAILSAELRDLRSERKR